MELAKLGWEPQILILLNGLFLSGRLISGVKYRAALAATEVVLVGYLVGVASVTLFPIIVDSYFIEQMRLHRSIWDGLNLIPLGGIQLGGDGVEEIARQAIGNLLIGVPFGLLAPFLGIRGPRRVLAAGLLFAVAIEGVQLLVDLVYQFDYRAIDINDVLLNTLGVGLGVALFGGLQAVYRRAGLDAKDVGAYLHAVMTS